MSAYAWGAANARLEFGLEKIAVSVLELNRRMRKLPNVVKMTTPGQLPAATNGMDELRYRAFTGVPQGKNNAFFMNPWQVNAGLRGLQKQVNYKVLNPADHAHVSGLLQKHGPALQKDRQGKIVVQPADRKFKSLQGTQIRHEQLEGKYQNGTPVSGHNDFRVLTGENNLLAGLTGTGSNRIRNYYQKVRGQLGETDLYKNVVQHFYGDRAAQQYGQFGQAKWPKAMRRDFDRRLNALGDHGQRDLFERLGMPSATA